MAILLYLFLLYASNIKILRINIYGLVNYSLFVILIGKVSISKNPNDNLSILRQSELGSFCDKN
jgi:hypothetical protein